MKALRIDILDSRGFTFIELMIAMAVAAITILFFVTSQNVLQINAEASYERKVAVQDAHRLLEQMRLTAKTGTFPTNISTTNFPAGIINTYNSMGTTASEVTTVAYAAANADPLDVTVTVAWTGYNRRTSSQVVRTFITQR